MARTVRKEAERALLQALACGATVESAARKAEVGERTAYRRLANPAFREQLNRLRADMVQRTAGLLTGAGMGSVKTLVDLQNDVAVPAGVRRRSARDVLEMGLKFRETAELEQRLAAVEQRLAGAAGQTPEDQSAELTP
jgi:phenylalanyl-tRNA synthetase beta subunit